jgi:hypothetical protein
VLNFINVTITNVTKVTNAIIFTINVIKVIVAIVVKQLNAPLWISYSRLPMNIFSS